MKAGRAAVDAVIRRLFTWPAVAVAVGVLALAWWLAQRSLLGAELPLAAASVALMAASTWSVSRARARAAAAGTAELDRKQAMFRDELDQRLEVQRQLRESEARVRAIIDSAPIVLFAIDRDGAITFSAGVGPDPLGKKPGEALGWSATDLFVEHPNVVEGIRQALSGIDGRAELTQGERTFSFSLAPFRDAAGNTAGAIDIHDDSIQAMFAVGLRLFALRTALHDPGQIEQMDRLQQNVQESTDRLRHLLFELRPAALDEGGLPAALRQYLDTMKEENGIEVELATALEQSPASETQVIAYRIAQEALANVRKHAQARRVECAVSAADDGILTRIVDNGLGFDSGGHGSVPGHLGLIAMRERAEMAGGWLRITSSAGHGCVVEFWIPDTREGVANAA
jgi:PAS domain-containing protein/two-component sensor histidine kinase